MFIVLKKLGWFFWANRSRYAIALVLLLALDFIEVAPSSLIGRAIDAMNQGTLTPRMLVTLLGVYAGLIVLMYSFGFTWMFQLFGGANLLQRTLRSRLMQHFLRMTPTFFEKHRTGDLMALATNDLNAVSQTAGFGILTLVDSTTFAATIMITMGWLISWKLTLFAMLPLPVIALLMTYYGRLIHARFMAAQSAFGDMNDRVLETISGIRVVRAYAQERAEERRFSDTTEDVFQKNIAVAKIDALFEPTNKLLVGLMYLIGLGYGSYMVFQSEITLGQLTAFNVYLGMLIWPMLAIGELINIMQRGNASLDRVNQTLSYQPDVEEPRTASVVATPEAIAFSHVTFRYPLSADDNLLDVSLTILRGETIGIVGRTGSGKSTLIKQLLREYPPGEGLVMVNGVPIQELALATTNGWLGYVPQESMLFSRSIEDNVRFGAADASDDTVWTALEIASFVKDLDTMPDGMMTLVGERGVSLSGGQKQRIALARALVTHPEILILDDAMSAVDARTEAHIVESIRTTRFGKTTLIATHRMSAVLHADLIVVMEQGRIVERGTHAALMAQGGWYQEQVLRQKADEGGDSFES